MTALGVTDVLDNSKSKVFILSKLLLSSLEIFSFTFFFDDFFDIFACFFSVNLSIEEALGSVLIRSET